jgi:phosphoribosylformylglycinamidine cyclo-ligase
MSGERRDGEALTYRASGVDIDAQDAALARIRQHLASTRTEGVLSDLGSFGGLFELPVGMDRPVLVASTDGVGTKVLVAQRAGRHDTVGEDLVNHCVGDILVMGARPLFFLDYFAVGRLDPSVAERIVAGVARGCRANECALLGGETAEMPDVYGERHYDLAGTIVGVVERGSLLDGSRVAEDDLLIGLGSSGLHTNGYTLARRIVFDLMELDPRDPMPGCDGTVADTLLAVHRSYLPALGPRLADPGLHALAHITGGGLTDNLPRVLPLGLHAEIELGSWPIPAVFRSLQRAGRIPRDDMLRTFNMGLGMVAIVSEQAAEAFLSDLEARGEHAWIVGRVASTAGQESRVRYSGDCE